MSNIIIHPFVIHLFFGLLVIYYCNFWYLFIIYHHVILFYIFLPLLLSSFQRVRSFFKAPVKPSLHSFDSLSLVSSSPTYSSYNLPSYVSTSLPHQRLFHPDYVALLQSHCDHDIIEIMLDTGTTFAITPHRSDFTFYNASNNPMSVSTVGGKTSIVGYGSVDWTLISFDGSHHQITVPTHHVPQSSVRLLSPQDYVSFIDADDSKDHYGGNQNWFWFHTTKSQSLFHCPIEPRSNLPIALATVGHSTKTFDHAHSNLSVLDETNQNISPAQKELLFWHFRFIKEDSTKKRFRQESLSPDTNTSLTSKRMSSERTSIFSISSAQVELCLSRSLSRSTCVLSNIQYNVSHPSYISCVGR